jgi:hypothetical protein
MRGGLLGLQFEDEALGLGYGGWAIGRCSYLALHLLHLAVGLPLRLGGVLGRALIEQTVVTEGCHECQRLRFRQASERCARPI